MEHKRSIGVTIFGWVLVILGGLYVLLLFIGIIFNIFSFKKFLSSLALVNMMDSSLTNYSSMLKFLIPFVSSTAIFWGLLYLICGIGLLKFKHWARYIVIFLMISNIIGLPNKGVLFGWQSVNILEILIPLAIFSFTIWFFMRKKVKKQFEVEGVKFKLISGYGVVITLIVLLTLSFPAFILLFKIQFGKPHFHFKKEVVKLKEISDNDFLDSHKRINLFDTGLLIPEDFTIYNFRKSPVGFSSFIGTPNNIKDDYIYLDTYKNVYASMGEALNFMKFKSAYDFQRAIYTNNLSPIFIILRNIAITQGEDLRIEEIDSQRFKGFIKSSHIRKDERWVYMCSLYSKNRSDSTELAIGHGKDKLNKNNVYSIISSFRFLTEQKTDAEKYYQKGLQSLKKNDFLNAPFYFANAFYLSPENPEYGYMLARILFENGKDRSPEASKRLFGSAKGILRDILVSNPNHKKSSELLENIESLYHD